MVDKKEGALEETIVTIISEQLGKEKGEIKLNARFVEDLGCDSLDLVELMMALEEEFKCDIPDEEAAKILTIQDAKDYIKIKLDQSSETS